MLRAALFLVRHGCGRRRRRRYPPTKPWAMVKRQQENFGKDGPDAVFRAITGKSSQPFHDHDLNAFWTGCASRTGAKEADRRRRRIPEHPRRAHREGRRYRHHAVEHSQRIPPIERAARQGRRQAPLCRRAVQRRNASGRPFGHRLARAVALPQVNCGDAGGGTSFTMRTVFKLLDISVAAVHLGQAEALEQPKRGEIAALGLVAGKPARSTANLHFLPGPCAKAFDADYFIASLTHDDDPKLIEPGKSVDVISLGARAHLVQLAEDQRSRSAGGELPRSARFRRSASFRSRHDIRNGARSISPAHFAGPDPVRAGGDLAQSERRRRRPGLGGRFQPRNSPAISARGRQRRRAEPGQDAGAAQAALPGFHETEPRSREPLKR
jgi:hypothetical protein